MGETFIVPVSALIFRHEGLRVATVVNGDVAHLVPDRHRAGQRRDG